ncbi:hypothetical protein C9374_004037 [Naegleria lovaniensis]|uniref:Uncharacterized protein n=1 Tax=Naegleria lovaniensis TaxID=51637 RepID=A0AA88H4D6_NAELO|nr:uncharacterized protein C9374_004037 [Naegleria lovaniensis]KAG2394273.1 hypothetical protein C9374_004037 [Naegleria lovaniensis]
MTLPVTVQQISLPRQPTQEDDLRRLLLDHSDTNHSIHHSQPLSNNSTREELVSSIRVSAQQPNSPSMIIYSCPHRVNVKFVFAEENDRQHMVEHVKLFVSSEHLLLLSDTLTAYKIHFRDILMHGVQQSPTLCMYCQLSTMESGQSGLAGSSEEEDFNDDDVCEMIITVATTASQQQQEDSSLESSHEQQLNQMYQDMYRAFSIAAENVPLDANHTENEHLNSMMNDINLDDKLCMNSDGWVYNIEEMRRAVLVRDRTEREEHDGELNSADNDLDDEDEWEDVDDEELDNKKKKIL